MIIIKVGLGILGFTLGIVVLWLAAQIGAVLSTVIGVIALIIVLIVLGYNAIKGR